MFNLDTGAFSVRPQRTRRRAVPRHVAPRARVQITRGGEASSISSALPAAPGIFRTHRPPLNGPDVHTRVPTTQHASLGPQRPARPKPHTSGSSRGGPPVVGTRRGAYLQGQSSAGGDGAGAGAPSPGCAVTVAFWPRTSRCASRQWYPVVCMPGTPLCIPCTGDVPSFPRAW